MEEQTQQQQETQSGATGEPTKLVTVEGATTSVDLGNAGEKSAEIARESGAGPRSTIPQWAKDEIIRPAFSRLDRLEKKLKDHGIHVDQE